MIPIARPVITEEDQARVLEVLASRQLSSGAWVEQFEATFAAYVGARFGIATSSGTTALQAVLEAAGIGPGDRVIVPPFTFVATSNAVVHRGAVPVFVDIEPGTFNLDPNRVEDALRRHRNVRAILVVHLYGLPARMDALCDLARRYGLLLIEDAAQAHGAAFQGRRAGSFGDAAIFSFYPTKNITTGEGGMIITSDEVLARRARLLVHAGAQDGSYEYEVVGYNFRMTNLAAALGLSQLERLDALNELRRQNAAYLTARLQDIPGIRPPVEPPEMYHVYNQYTIRIRERDALREFLAGQGIQTRIYYPRPVPATQAYRSVPYEGGPWPETERACREVLSLPVHPSLCPEDLRRIVEAVRAFADSRAVVQK
ncbi:MAG: DegT/DnrJ/EryC1/StrS family aminotransferase [Armatimonadota bacterium]|nr:DegT/DnrJ/EryC1/StrS family aminotransferase [Armatimonadota bacterium]MDR7563381.1 DegT/DnrJ/EryC1/StrS family aminotransferase [Armatimonadota bacterium]MDR7567431.1 DegT/DnrJ/EryC1/StrS family aminotransferase [Armatimonadota bacterium]MDR7601684.1 DegT/DnrJ/EryC1/StrS family aminotransferase [Armatimonadota bacterium]